MVALSGIGGPLGLTGVEGPAVFQLLAVPVPSCDDGTRVIAATEDAAGMDTVEIAHGSEIALGTVGMVVTPGFHLSAFRDIVGGSHSGSGESVENGDVFGTVHNAPGLVVIVGIEVAATAVVNLGACEGGRERFLDFGPFLLTAAGILTVLLYFAEIGFRIGLDGCDAIAPVGMGVANDFTLSVNGTVGGLHHEFSASVAIEVEDHELFEMSTTTNVLSEVDAPEAGSIKTVAVDVGVAGETREHIVLGVGGIPFEENLILSVAIHIAYAGIACDEGIAEAVG